MSKALNELKKATMAAYLAKAGGHVRAGTSIAKSFDDDVFRHMKVVNQHSPFNVHNGVEKDPEKLAHATKQMNVNAELRDQFKRGAQNRIKGIGRAGRLMAKEETIVEAGKNPYGPGYKLVDKDGTELKVGHKFMHTSHHEGSKPEHHEITGWQSGAQRGNSSSSGRVAVKVGKGKKAYDTEYFPHVFDMKVVKEDAVNEVSPTTLASVATQRFAQAQAALKAKDFGGYVKNKAESMKAADATTPKSGWSPEDDKKNEEVAPVVSAQEKYRQIKEAKVKKALKKDYASGKGMRAYGDPPKGNVSYGNEPTGPFSTKASDAAKAKQPR